MNGRNMGAGHILVLIFSFMMGCTNYTIPIQTQEHPASSKAQVTQIELSPILDISEGDRIQNQEEYDSRH